MRNQIGLLHRLTVSKIVNKPQFVTNLLRQCEIKNSAAVIFYKNIDLNFISVKTTSVKVGNIDSECNKWVCEIQHSQKESGLDGV